MAAVRHTRCRCCRWIPVSPFIRVFSKRAADGLHYMKGPESVVDGRSSANVRGYLWPSAAVSQCGAEAATSCRRRIAARAAAVNQSLGGRSVNRIIFRLTSRTESRRERFATHAVPEVASMPPGCLLTRQLACQMPQSTLICRV